MEALAGATSRLRRASINAGTSLFRIKMHPIEDSKERKEHRLDALEAADHPVRELEPSPDLGTHGQEFMSALRELLDEEYRLLTRPDPPPEDTVSSLLEQPGVEVRTLESDILPAPDSRYGRFLTAPFDDYTFGTRPRGFNRDQGARSYVVRENCVWENASSPFYATVPFDLLWDEATPLPEDSY